MLGCERKIEFINSTLLLIIGDTMAKTKSTIDTILMSVVPRSITEDNRIVHGDPDYWTRIEEEVNAFLQRLPSEYKGTPVSERFEDAGAQAYHYTGSSCHLGIGFSPAYVYAGGNVNGEAVQEVRCPTIDIIFNVTSPETATTILHAALAQFFMYETDYLDESLAIVQARAHKPLANGLAVFKLHLPKGTIIKSVTDAITGVGEASYTI